MDIRVLWRYESGTIILLLEIGHHKDILGVQLSQISLQSFLQKLKTSKPLSMTGFQRFLTSNYRVNEYIEYTGGIFTWKNQQF